MVRAEFFKKKDIFVGFRVSGHAGFAEVGSDIVCSAVSSSVRMCCNGLVEIAKVEVEISVSEDVISLEVDLKVAEDLVVQVFLKALEFEISLISRDYGKNVVLIKTEV